MGFLFRGHESKLLAKLLHYRLKKFAIAAILSLLGAGFEIAVELQDRGIVRVLAVGRKNAVQAAENSILPGDECAVTIKREDIEAVEVEHGRGLVSQARQLRLEAGQYRSFLAGFAGGFRL